MVVGTVLDILFSSFRQCQTCNFHLSHAICFCRVQISCLLHWTLYAYYWSTWTTGCMWYMHENWQGDIYETYWRLEEVIIHAITCCKLKSSKVTSCIWGGPGSWALNTTKVVGVKERHSRMILWRIFILILVGTKGLLRALSHDPLNLKSYGY